MFQELKNCYQKIMGIIFSKSDVFIKEVYEGADIWEQTD